MPFLIPLLMSGAAFFGGAFIGSQVDDSIDQPPQGVPATQGINVNQIILYGIVGIGMFWAAKNLGFWRL